MRREYKLTCLLVSTGALSCYPASMVNLIWFANEKCLATEQHGDMKSGVSLYKNLIILQAWCPSALSCSNLWKTSYPHRHLVWSLCDHFDFFCGCNCKTSKICHQRTRFFTIGAG